MFLELNDHWREKYKQMIVFESEFVFSFICDPFHTLSWLECEKFPA